MGGWKIADLSSWQHPNGATIDFKAMAEGGIVGVIVKATQGTGYVNPYFATDVAAAHEAGLLVGAYHFAQFGTTGDPSAEIAHFKAVVGSLVHELGLWLDVEDNGGKQWYELGDPTKAALDELAQGEALSGLYTDQAALDGLTGAPWAHKLWIADPSGTYGGAAWARQLAPQNVPGVQGLCDVSELLAGRGLNPYGDEAPEAPQGPAPAPVPQQPTPAPSGPLAPSEADVQLPELRSQGQGPYTYPVPLVAIVQRWAGVAADGKFGPQTEIGVKAMQGRVGIGVDGIVGPQTYGKIFGLD